MKRGIGVIVLAVLGGLLLVASSLAGIAFDDGGMPRTVSSARGATVSVYGGEGLYRYDSVTKAVLFRGFDWANLFVCLPIGLWAVLGWLRSRLREGLLLAAVFAYLAYNYLIGVMGNAYNQMFLVWTALYSAGLFGLALVVAGLDITSLPGRAGGRFPRWSLSVYLTVLALFLTAQYLWQIAPALLTGTPPAALEHYTTLELAALELGIMIPLHLAGAVLLWRSRPLGYLLGAVLVFTALMTFVSLTVAAFISALGYGIGGGADVAIPAILTVVAAWFSFAVFGAVGDGHGGAATQQWRQLDARELD